MAGSGNATMNELIGSQKYVPYRAFRDYLDLGSIATMIEEDQSVQEHVSDSLGCVASRECLCLGRNIY